jgi:hypothetical protein
VASAFDAALGEVEQPAPAFLDLEGMSGRRYRLFVNALNRLIPDPRYLEVGVWTGSTLCSAIAGNHVRAVGIDNWSQFGAPRERLLENLRCFSAGSEVRLIECDFRTVPFAEQGRFNVYFFDGPHSVVGQHDGLIFALPALDPKFVLIVDDWNWVQVRTGTYSAIEELHLEVVYAIEVRTTADDTHPPHCGFEAKETDWHNGYFIAVLRKSEDFAASSSGTARSREAPDERASAERYAFNPAICEVLALITHHYRPEHLPFLTETLRGLAELGVRRTHAVVVTSTADPTSLTSIQNAGLLYTTGAFSIEVVTAPPLLHPHDLPWAQKPLITERFLGSGSTFTHLVSLEDDLAFGREGFRYWLEYRPLLAAHKLIPSFLRTEMRLGDPVIYATDIARANSLRNQRMVRVGSFAFVALHNPHCALFVMDRTLAREHAASASFDMRASMSMSDWATRERAAMGLCWDDPPPGFRVRYVVPVNEATMSVAPCSYVRHLPANYANDPRSQFGKLPVGAVLAP